MKPSVSVVQVTEFTPVDELERLQLRIAQRADDLSKTGSSSSGSALENWLQAEREILGDIIG
jgi:hypothetical protein